MFKDQTPNTNYQIPNVIEQIIMKYEPLFLKQ